MTSAAESIDAAFNDTPAAEEESHVDVWRSMETVVVRDCSSNLAAPRQEPVEDSPASSSCSSGSSTPTSGGSTPRRVVHITAAGSTPETAATEDGETVDFNDLFGDDGTDADFVNMSLPSVQEAQSQLEGIKARRAQIKAMSAKYASPAVGQSSQQTLPGIAKEDDGDAGDKPSSQRKSDSSPSKFGPMKVFGPSLRPDAAEVNGVMQQLGSRLRQLKIAESSSAADASAPATTEADAATVLAAGPSSGFTIGGRPSKANIAAETAPAAKLGIAATSPSSSNKAIPVDEEKLKAGKVSEERRREEMWQSFLAGDDLPVGDDGLPPPELYYGGSAH